ncbi:helicase, partial [candidate division KSB1 bacterium]|nr:helicase [candidate division KSB1 bacterium]
FDEDDDTDALEQFTLGKKRLTKLADIDRAGKLEAYKTDLKTDIEALQLLQSNLSAFEKKIAKEIAKEKTKAHPHKSLDDKLQTLIRKINEKRAKGENNGNPKALIFTVYKDTAFYLFDQLTARGFDNVAVVSGDAAKISGTEGETKRFEPILERFAPFTKLFREKQWAFQPSKQASMPLRQFEEWRQWIAENDSATNEKLQNPIDILIATDVLSEGQNLQDCDLVINYDIHWNPVRVIQRMGRIDRLGSPNDTIFGINFWPSDNINAYLDLQSRIEKRMAQMKLAGSEVHLDFSQSFRAIAEDEELEQRQKAKMLEQMQASWDEVETGKTLGFDDFSLETFRQELLQELREKEHLYRQMPNGIYTGFIPTSNVCPEAGIIALLGYPRKPPKAENFRYKSYELLYITMDGNTVLPNQKEILDALGLHKDAPRAVPAAIDRGEPEAVRRLSQALKTWLKSQIVEETEQDDGTTKQTMGKAQLELLNKLKSGSKAAARQIQEEPPISERYAADNVDLIVWFIVSKTV